MANISVGVLTDPATGKLIPLRMIDNGDGTYSVATAPAGSGTGGGTERTAALGALLTSAGTVAAGAKSVTFFNSGSADATVAGGPLAPNRGVTFSVDGADTLGAIDYTASATATLQIAKVT